MREKTNQNKLVAVAVKQNLLLWEISKSFLDLEKKIMCTLGNNHDELWSKNDS